MLASYVDNMLPWHRIFSDCDWQLVNNYPTLFVFVFQTTRHTIRRWHVQVDVGVQRRLSEQTANSSLCFSDVPPKWLGFDLIVQEDVQWSLQTPNKINIITGWSRSAISRGRYPRIVPSDCDIKV